MNAAGASSGGDFAGRVLGDRYLLGEKLGSGGYGTVYAAVQRDLGRPVAVKVLDGRVTDQDVVRFEREARAAAALGHPHIVQVTDFSSRPGEPPFLVMEMLAGETLSYLMNQHGRIPPIRIVAIASQVLAALDVAHRAGIVHRDVKPANIFLVANVASGDFVKLLDFGIAKVGGDATAITQSGAMLGSPAYMAPEQVKGLNVDPRTDVYALGATIYHALSGRYPFDAPTVHALLYAIAESWPPALASLDPSIDPRLVAIVERSMQKDPAMRFQSAGEMRAALDACVGPVPGPTMQYMPTAALPMPPPPKSSGALVAILAVVGVLLFAAVAIVGLLYWTAESGHNPSATTATSTSPSPPITAAPPPSPSASSTATATTVATTTSTAKKAAPTPTTPKEAFAGTNPKFSSGTYRKPMKSATARPAIDAALPAITQCFVATEFDPPDHRSTAWTVVVDASGIVTSATRKDTKNAHPKLDACVTTALRTMRIASPEGGGSFDVSFFAPAKGDL